MEQEYKYMVVTSCMTYNHAPYIVDAMNGFAMQETTFHVYYLITDDASTDGEPEVIKQYLAYHFQTPYRTEETDDYYLICAVHKTNPNCNFIVFFLKYNHYSIKKSKLPYQTEWRDNAKYIALCEGDDYWIYPKKLQMQVEFLEEHPSHSLCIHAYRKDLLDNDSTIESIDIHKYSEDKEIIPDEDVLNITGRFNTTAAKVYRRDAITNYPDWARKAPIGDRPLKLVLFSKGHIGYIDKVMSVYRVGTKSSWTLRMRNDSNYRIRNINGRLQLALDFDNYTCGKYHSIIKKEIKYLRVRLIKEYVKKYIVFFRR